MSIVRVGTTKQYADNWDKIFGSDGRTTATKKKAARTAKASAKKKPAQKKVPKSARKPSHKK